MSRVMLIVTGLTMGGAECQVVGLADGLAARGHEVLLLSLTGEPVVLPLNATVRVVCMRMKKTLSGFIAANRQAASLLREFRPDVVHSHMIHSNVFARLLRLHARIPRLICTAHNTYEGGRLRQLAYRATDALADLSTNVSQEAVDAFVAQKAVPEGRMIAVHNGIDDARFRFDLALRDRVRTELELANSDVLLLAVGRLIEQKDYPNLLSAFAEVLSRCPSAHLAIVGVGELQAPLQAEAEAAQLLHRVRFLGLRRDIPALMSACDVFVLSSAWEGFGLVVAEAMACERLVVATDSGGVREVVGDTGELVPPRQPQLLAEAILRSLDLGPEERRQRGTMARARVLKRYSMDAAVSRWLDIYEGRHNV